MDINAEGTSGWFALAVVNAGLAEQKNRSRLNWFLVSLFLGPIATVLIVVWEAPDKATTPPAPIQLSTGLLAIGILLLIGAGALGVLASTSGPTSVWIAAAMLGAGAMGCFIAFIVRRPTDAADAQNRLAKPGQRQG